MTPDLPVVPAWEGISDRPAHWAAIREPWAGRYWVSFWVAPFPVPNPLWAESLNASVRVILFNPLFFAFHASRPSFLDPQDDFHGDPHVLRQSLAHAESSLLQCAAHVNGTAIQELRKVLVRPLEYIDQRVLRACFGHAHHD